MVNNSTTIRGYFISYDPMLESKLYSHHEHRLRDSASSANRHFAQKKSSRTKEPPTCAQTTLPGNVLAQYALGTTREVLEQQFGSFCTRYDEDVYARVFLGSK
jgi:hypothetical protein